MQKKICRRLSVVLLMVVTLPLQAQNNSLVDEKLVHFGFSLSADFLSYGVIEAPDSVQIERNGTVYHVRTTTPGAGFSAGFIADLRLTRYLNLRFCPAIRYGQRSVTYQNDSIATEDIHGISCQTNKPKVVCLPIELPLYLKWSAEREGNYRPYVSLGGGVGFDIGRKKDRVILQKTMDYFMEIGIGCDLYFSWFKLAPEIRYRIGFNNVLTPISDYEKEQWKISADDYFYTNALSRLTNQQISLVFNFE